MLGLHYHAASASTEDPGLSMTVPLSLTDPNSKLALQSASLEQGIRRFSAINTK